MERRNKKTKSVGNGEGSLYYSDTLKRWVFQYVINNSRKTLKQRKKETVKEFKARVTEIKNQINTDTYIERSQETVITLCSEHIEQKYIDKIISPRSYKRDLETLEQIKKTCSIFCNIPIQKVTIRHIEAAKKEIMNYANSTIDKIWTLLNKAFSIACSPSRRILIYNIMQDETLRKPLSNKKTEKITSLPHDEYDKLIYILDNEESEHPYRDILKMQALSGMRIGEVLARSINDYNEKEKTFYIYNTLTEDENYNVIWSEHTKTYNKKTQHDEGARYLPLNNNIFNELIPLITKKRKLSSIKNIHNLLFWDYEKDTYISPKEVNSYLYRLNIKYKISNKSLSTHRLRHTALTYWKEMGLDISIIQYLAGHVDGSKITDKTYIDTSFDYVKRILNETSNSTASLLH